LGERFNGIEEVGGSIPPGSTSKINKLKKQTRFSIDRSGDKSPPRRHCSASLPSIGVEPSRKANFAGGEITHSTIPYRAGA
jgi:hypothetical protein